MSQEISEKECHQRMASKLSEQAFNLLYNKDQRSNREDELMIHSAHGACLHYDEIGNPLDWARSEWLLTRVYIAVNRPVPAVFYGQRCIALCKERNLGPFPTAYAYEALARAAVMIKDSKSYEELIKDAREFGEKIEEEKDREMFFNELKTIPEIEEQA